MKRGRNSRSSSTGSILSGRKARVALGALGAATAFMSIGSHALAQTVSNAAGTYWWDVNGATTNANTGTISNGTWSSTVANWTTDSTGASATTTWVSDSEARFSAGTNSTGASTVTVIGSQNIFSIQIEEGSYTFATGTGGAFVLDNAVAATWTLNGSGTFNVPISSPSAASNTVGPILLRGSALTVAIGGNNTFDNAISSINLGTTGAVTNGTLLLTSSNALGSTVGATTLGVGQAVMIAANNLNVPENIFLSSTASCSFGNTSGNTDTESGTFNINKYAANGSAYFVPAGTLTLSGLVQDGTVNPGNAFNLNKANTGTLILTGTSSFTGNLNVRIGTMIVNGSGLVTGAASYNVNSGLATNGALVVSGNGSIASAAGGMTIGARQNLVGFASGVNTPLAGQLIIDKSGVNNADNVASMAMTLQGGSDIRLLGNSTQASSETLGDVTIAGATDGWFTSRNNISVVGAAGGLTQLNFGNYTRNVGGQVVFRGANLGTAASGANNTQITLANGAGLNVGAGGTGTFTSIIPGALGDATTSTGSLITNSTGYGTDFVTYGANGVRLLTAAEYSPTVTGTNANVSLSTASSTSAASINSLRLNGSGSGLTISNTLNINSGMLLVTGASQGNAGISGGTINAGGAELQITTQANTTITSQLAGNNGMSKHGSGTLTLTANSSGLSGTTYLEDGVTVISDGNALGTGKTSIAPGAALVMNGTHVTHDISLGGTYNSLNLGSIGGAPTIDQLTSSAGLNGSIGNLEALTGTSVIDGNILLSGTATPGDPLSNGPAPGTGTGNAPGNNIANPGLNTLGVAAGATLTLNGSISNNTAVGGAGSFVKIGQGTLVLNNTNSIPTLFRLFDGVVNVAHDQALGGGTGPVFYVAGARTTIGFSNNVHYNVDSGTDRDLTSTTGYGAGSLGIIDNFGGDNVFNNNVTFNLSTGAFATFLPNYIGSQAGTLTFTGIIQPTAGTTLRKVVKVGAGTIVFQNDLRFTGQFDIEQGAVVLGSNPGVSDGEFLAGSANATLLNVANVYPGATLVVDQTNNNKPDRFSQGGTNAAITSGPIPAGTGVLVAGEFKIVGRQGEDTDYNVNSTGAGSINFTGSPTLTVAQPSGSSNRVNMQLSHTRATAGFTPLVRGDGLGVPNAGTSNNQITNSVAPTLVGAGSGSGSETKIVPWAYGDSSSSGDGSDLVTYGAAGFRPLVSSEYLPTLPNADTNSNVAVTASSTATANNGVNGLKIGAGADLALGSTIMTVKSGAILAAAGGGATTISGGGVDFQTQEGIIHTAAGHDLTINSLISGSNGLTKSGPAQLTLGANNNFTGGAITLNGGTLVVNADGNLGGASMPINMNGGVLRPGAANATLAAGHAITLGSKGGGFDVPGSQSFTVAGTISPNSTFAGGAFAPLTKLGSGTLTLSPAVSNAYTGGTVVKAGTLRVAADSALGSNTNIAAQNNNTQNPGSAAPLILDGGTISFSASTGMGQRAIFLGKNNGTIGVDAGATVTYDFNTGSNVGLIPLTGPGTLTKVGDGTFEFLSNSPNYFGGTEILGGTIRIDTGTSLPGGTGTQSRIVHMAGGTLLLNTGVTQTLAFDQLGQNGTLATLGSSTLASSTSYPRFDNGSSSTLFAPAAGVLTINSQASNPDPTNVVAPTINIRGGGTTYFLAQPFPNFVANYNVDGATLRINDQNPALGLQTNGIAFSSAGGTLDTRVSSVGKTYNYPVTLNGNGTFVASSTVAAGQAAVTNAFGGLTVNGNQVLTFAPASAANGYTSGNAGLTFGTTTLNGDLTVTVNNTATGTGSVVLGANYGTATGTTGALTPLGVGQTGGSHGITKNGAGVLSIYGNATYTGVTTLSSGTLNMVGANAWAPALSGAGGAVLNGGRLVLDYSSNVASDPISTVRSIVAAGNAGSFQTGQIRTTNAADDRHAIGYFDDTTAKVVRLGYTYRGDADVNGLVNTADFTALGQHFNNMNLATAGSPMWSEGDFNYDGKVNALDFNALATNFGAATIPAPVLDGAPVLGSLVPEPGTLSLAALGVATLAGRRRRR